MDLKIIKDNHQVYLIQENSPPKIGDVVLEKTLDGYKPFTIHTENDKEDSQCILLAAYPKIEGVILLPKWEG